MVLKNSFLLPPCSYIEVFIRPKLDLDRKLQVRKLEKLEKLVNLVKLVLSRTPPIAQFTFPSPSQLLFSSGSDWQCPATSRKRWQPALQPQNIAYSLDPLSRWNSERRGGCIGRQRSFRPALSGAQAYVDCITAGLLPKAAFWLALHKTKECRPCPSSLFAQDWHWKCRHFGGFLVAFAF